MTDEVAYKLGKFDFPSFYNIVLWRVNKEPFELAPFFKWELPGMGVGCKFINGEWVTDWESIAASGYLKLEEIKEISHKLAYIRGRLDNYSISISKNEISVHYANSYNFRDFLAQCFEDVIKYKFKKDYFNQPPLHYYIKKGENIGTIPGTPSVTLLASEEIIKYIAEDRIK